ncbi:MAG: S4 domain-containing protein [Bacteroidales bacterium]|jgi:ribosome-associated heat shock protein Hsp15|nr:S4 domain-containing protein [Bacteroidales bacterium]
MTTQKGERIDKFLWHVRLFSSRSAATEACRKGRVTVGGQPVKPSYLVSEGATVLVRKPPVTYSYLIKAFPPARVGAKLVPVYISDLTPEEEKNKLLPGLMNSGHRPRGTGRPTKRERRDIEDFLN